MSQERIPKLRKRVTTYRGVRKIRAEAELVLLLMDEGNAEAQAIADDAIRRGRELLARAIERKMDAEQYENALAWILRAKAEAQRNVGRQPASLILLNEAILLFRKAENDDELFHSHYFKHVLLREMQDLRGALEELEHAQTLARQLKMNDKNVEILGEMGTVNMLLDNFDVARRQLEEALAAVRERGNKDGEFIMLYHLGNLFENAGDMQNATHWYQQALDLACSRANADLLPILHFTWTYAAALDGMGRTTDALGILDEWMARAREATHDYSEVSFLEFKTRLHVARAEYVEALESATRALSIFERVGSRVGVATSLGHIGAVYSACGFRDIADGYFSASCAALASIDIQRPTPDVTAQCVALRILAAHGYAGLDVPSYLKFLEAAAEAHPLGAYKHKYLVLRLSLSILMALNGAVEAACRHLQEILELSERLNYRNFQCDIHYYLGRIQADVGKFEMALSEFEQALQLARASDRKDLERDIHRRMALAYENVGASELAQRSRASERGLIDATQGRRVRLELELMHYKGETKRYKKDRAQLEKELASAREDAAAQRRVVETKNAHTAHLTDTLDKIVSSLRPYEHETDAGYRLRVSQLALDIRTAIDKESWREFEEEVREQDDDFLQRLERDFPALSNAERRICALIRVNAATSTTKELSRMLNVSPRTVQSYRYHLRKKFGLGSDDDLLRYIREL